MGSISTGAPQRQVYQANSAIWAILTTTSLTSSFSPQSYLNSMLCICSYTILKLIYGVGVDSDVLDLHIFEIWLFWISAMKFLNHFWNITKIGNRFIGSFINVVSLPLNKILRFSLGDSWIKDFWDFKFFLSFNLNRRRWYLKYTWYRLILIQLQ
jgi:hypothetical protein